jgi:hypothetical protein
MKQDATEYIALCDTY